MWQVRYSSSSCSTSCCNTWGCGWRCSHPWGRVLRYRSWAASLNHPYLDHPYLMLHTPATATWVTAHWTEGLHLMCIITERSSSFTLQILKTCPGLRSGSDTNCGYYMGPRGLRVPFLGGHCYASCPTFRAWCSRRYNWGVPNHVVSAFPTSCFFFWGAIAV